MTTDIIDKPKRVSIHAPARGATGHDETKGVRRGVSIHAPARGATMYHSNILSLFPFQSTLPRGERHTHKVLPQYQDSFNPRSRAGSDCQLPCALSLHYGFNPRSRAGSDSSAIKGQIVCMVSIHAPARGATNFYLTN